MSSEGQDEDEEEMVGEGERSVGSSEGGLGSLEGHIVKNGGPGRGAQSASYRAEGTEC